MTDWPLEVWLFMPGVTRVVARFRCVDERSAELLKHWAEQNGYRVSTKVEDVEA